MKLFYNDELYRLTDHEVSVLEYADIFEKGLKSETLYEVVTAFDEIELDDNKLEFLVTEEMDKVTHDRLTSAGFDSDQYWRASIEYKSEKELLEALEVLTYIYSLRIKEPRFLLKIIKFLIFTGFRQ